MTYPLIVVYARYIQEQFFPVLLVRYSCFKMESKQIPLKIRKLIVRDHQNHESFRKIAAKYALSYSGVRKVWKKFEQCGSVADKSGRGRKRLTSPREDSRIVREARRCSSITSRAIRENLNLKVSERIIRYRLQEAGLKSKYASRRPLIRKVNRIKRLKFAQKYAEQPVEFWKRVVWSDESKFELFGKKQRPRVWIKSGERLLDQNVQKTVKHGGGSIMVWGCFSWSSVGNLVEIEGIMTADRYIDIINENLEESLLKMGLEESFIFQQDNDPKHTARKSTAFFKANRIKLLEWPPQSPDLNPIENLWSILDRQVDKGEVTNKTKLFKALNEAWQNIDETYLHNLVESMPRRLQAVIQAKGGHTKY